MKFTALYNIVRVYITIIYGRITTRSDRITADRKIHDNLSAGPGRDYVHNNIFCVDDIIFIKHSLINPSSIILLLLLL